MRLQYVEIFKFLKDQKVIGTCSSPSIVAGQDLKTFGFLSNCSQGFDRDTCDKEIACFKNHCKNNETCEPTDEKRFVNGSHCKNDESCKRNEVIGYKCICEESILVE